MRIGEVARRANLRQSTIRYYEQLGLLRKPHRISGRRDYGPEILPRLRLITMLQRLGFTLSEIRTLADTAEEGTATDAMWRDVAAGQLSKLDAEIETLQTARNTLLGMMDCRCEGQLSSCSALGPPQP